MRANLHLHSLRSDGTQRPAAVAESAAAVGLEAAALTDHDTLGGVPEFLKAARSLGLSAWPGAEIDVVDHPSGYKGEILAYFPRGGYEATRRFLAGVAELRRGRARTWMERVPDVFFRRDLSFEELLRFKAEELEETCAEGDYSLGKADLFRYLKSRGALSPSSEYKEFKKAYFSTGLLSDGKYQKPELTDVVEAVRSDGGVCSLPHPGHEFDDDLAAMRSERRRFAGLLDRMREVGVRGVEIYLYRNQDSDAINRLVSKAAASAELFLTYGSDCHGPGSGKYSIRDFHGDFPGWPES